MYYGNGIVNAYATLASLEGNNIPGVPASPIATVHFDKKSYTVNEDTRTLDVYVDVVRNTGSTDPITIKFEALSGSGTSGAVQGVDYALQTGTLTFNANERSKSFPIQIIDNGFMNEDKAFNVKISSTNNVAIADPTSLVTILDTDYPIVGFAQNSYTVNRNAANNGELSFKVNLKVTNAGQTSIKVYLSTDDGSAKAGIDYVAQQNTLVTLSPGQTTPVSVTVKDSGAEDTKYFTLRLTNAQNAKLASPSAITVWIVGTGLSDTTLPESIGTIDTGTPPSDSGWYKTDMPVTIHSDTSMSPAWYSSILRFASALESVIMLSSHANVIS
jgi:hypothetical protein